MKKIIVVNKNRMMQMGSLVILLVAFLVFVFHFYTAYVEKVSKTDGAFFFVKSASSENIGPILPGQEIVQTYTATRDNMIGVNLAFQAIGNGSETEVHVSFIEDETEQVIQEWLLQGSQIALDGSFQFLPFSRVVDNMKGKHYRISVSVEDAELENTVTLLKTGSTIYGSLTVDGNEIDGNIALGIKGFVGYIGKVFWGISILFMGVLIWIYWSVFVFGNWKYENLFLVLGSLLVVIYLFVFTPYTEPDSNAHMATVYYYTYQILGEDELNADGRMLIYQDEAERSGLSIEPNLVNINTVKENILAVEEIQNKTPCWEEPLSVPPTAYVPQIVGAVLGKCLHLGTVSVLMLIKLFGGIFYLACCYFAIKLMPFGKLVMFVCALLPMSLELNTSSSYDNVTISLAYVLTAYIFWCAYQKERVTYKDIVLLIILSAWIAPIKIVYFLIGSLCILIPSSKFNNSKWRYGIIASVLGSGLLSIVISRLGYVASIASGNNLERGTYTWEYIMSDLTNSFNVLMRTVLNRTPEYLAQAFGGYFSWFSVGLSWTFVLLFMLVVLMSSLRGEEEKQYLDTKAKILVGSILFLVIGCTVMGLWLDWTPKEYTTIEGVQGRYFLPCLPLLVLLFRNNTIVLKRRLDKSVIMMYTILHYVTIMNIYAIAISR